MLKGIPLILSPELMKVMMEMGHGDELIIADGNFPAVTLANRLVRCDGHKIPELLKAVMLFYPLDQSVEFSVAVMALSPSDKPPSVWDEYRSIITHHDESFKDLDFLERYAFYERAKQAFAVITTSDQSFKGNILLKKGVVRN